MKRSKNQQNEVEAIVTPKLRFPEFQGESGWCVVPLKSACQMQAGKFVEASNIYGIQSGGLFPCYGGNGLRGYTASFTHSGRYPLIGRQGALCGNVKLATGDFHATEHAVVATAQGGVDIDWLYYTLGLSNLNQYATGQAQPGLSVEVLDKVPIALPPRENEQKKVAECLGTLDELIGAESQKLDALKSHKKGLMQQLFPREGETLPRLRFPEFRSAPEWMPSPFDEFVSSSFYGTSSSTSAQGRYPVLRMGNMVDGGLDLTDLVYIDLEPKSFESLRLEAGDILLNRTNSPALVGKISLFQLDSEFLTASYIVAYRLKKERINPLFCNYLLNSPRYQVKIRSIAKPSISQANINPTTFRKELNISIPSLDEQHRIALCLSSLDDLIAAHSGQLDALKLHKKGLMQQLFPAPVQPEG